MSYEAPALDTTKLLEALKWRYAVKAFDPAQKIDEATWTTLEEALVLTPSSYGLQPWKFLIIRDPELRAKLKPHAHNQGQVTDASHFVVFALRKNLDTAFIENYVRRIAVVRQVAIESLKGYHDAIIGSMIYGERSLTVNTWASNQVFIALGQFLLAAAALKIDACPMEGFNRWAFDDVLGLGKRGLAAVVCAAVGYRSAEDKYAKVPKVRYEAADVIEHL